MLVSFYHNFLRAAVQPVKYLTSFAFILGTAPQADPLLAPTPE